MIASDCGTNVVLVCCTYGALYAYVQCTYICVVGFSVCIGMYLCAVWCSIYYVYVLVCCTYGAL